MSVEQFLKAHYCSDDLDKDQIRHDCEHWERVGSNPEKFPNADMEFIDRFTDAAIAYLALNDLR